MQAKLIVIAVCGLLLGDRAEPGREGGAEETARYLEGYQGHLQRKGSADRRAREHRPGHQGRRDYRPGQ